MPKLRQPILHAAFLIVSFLGFVPGKAVAKGAAYTPLDEVVTSIAIEIVIGASIILAILVFAAFHFKHTSEATKKLLFFSIIGTVLLATVYLIASTVYVNVQSSSQGPVHWHADFEIWTCGKKVDLKNPKGWSNKIGTATFHEHNDNRIHVEGVVMKPDDVSLGNFFRVIDGELTDQKITLPLENELVTYTNGDTCPETGEQGEVQVFVYTVTDNIYSQRKVADYTSYILSPQPNVPPADCIIIEFSEPKDRTGKLCKSYHVADQIGKIKKQ